MLRLSKIARGAAVAVLSVAFAMPALSIPATSWAQPRDRDRDRAQQRDRDSNRDRRGVGDRVRERDANRDRDRYRRREPSRPPSRLRTLPRGYNVVRSRERQYFVHRGHFYERAHDGFVLIHPPIGVIVTTLPLGYVVVHIAGVRYFVSGGVYYRPAPSGYVIVEPPQPAPVTRETHTVMVQVENLNVRRGPGLDFEVVGVVSQGVRLLVYGDAPDWYYVRLPDGTFGWVMHRLTVPVGDQPQG